ncbi:MAG: hypothetical protein WCU88_11425 [Elusimicrobiota bacterium]|jgi:hypothetical protein
MSSRVVLLAWTFLNVWGISGARAQELAPVVHAGPAAAAAAAVVPAQSLIPGAVLPGSVELPLPMDVKDLPQPSALPGPVLAMSVLDAQVQTASAVHGRVRRVQAVSSGFQKRLGSIAERFKEAQRGTFERARSGLDHLFDFQNVSVSIDDAAVSAGSGFLGAWLDGKHHDHRAPDPAGSGFSYVFYVKAVQGNIYIDAGGPGQSEGLAGFQIRAEELLEDMGRAPKAGQRPYFTAFEPRVPGGRWTRMLIVEFDPMQSGFFRFMVVPRVSVIDARGGFSDARVSSYVKDGRWSPWISRE